MNLRNEIRIDLKQMDLEIFKEKYGAKKRTIAFTLSSLCLIERWQTLGLTRLHSFRGQSGWDILTLTPADERKSRGFSADQLIQFALRKKNGTNNCRYDVISFPHSQSFPLFLIHLYTKNTHTRKVKVYMSLA